MSDDMKPWIPNKRVFLSTIDKDKEPILALGGKKTNKLASIVANESACIANSAISKIIDQILDEDTKA